ncbi:MAG: hypothetical protein RIR51_1366, partial [Bacteroidota bacterium]
MKSLTRIVIGLLYIISFSTFSQVKLGNLSNPINSSAQMELESSTRGFLPPRMTETQRNSIPAPADGLLIYNTTSNSLNYYSNGKWQTWNNTIPEGNTAVLNSLTCTNLNNIQSGELKSYNAVGANPSVINNIPAGLTGVKDITNSGANNAIALKEDGTIEYWGSYNNVYWPLSSYIPTNLTGIKAVASGEYFSAIVQNDGTVQVFGREIFGGNSGYNDRYTELPVGLNNVTAVAVGWTFGLALKADSTVVGWGGQYFAPDNLRYVGDVISGINAALGTEKIIAITAGLKFACALTKNGKVICWGNQGGNAINVPTDAQSGVVEISSSSIAQFVMARKSDGTVRIWGNNSAHNEVNSTLANQLNNIVSIAAGNNEAVALRNDGTIFHWGYGAPDNNYKGTVPFNSNFSKVVTVNNGVLILERSQPTLKANTYNLGLANNSTTYSGDPGVSYQQQIYSSIGVKGLTATLPAGSLSSTSGTLPPLVISGYPDKSG